ncbi:aspartyl protease family protein At5g10770-like [Wolffia australiana]
MAFILEILSFLSFVLFSSSSRALTIENSFSVLRMEDLSTPANCSRTTVDGGHSMKIVHRYGPCSASNEAEPSPSEVLAQDALRVASLQARASGKINRNQSIVDEKSVTLPTQSSLNIGYNNYVVTIGLGTPSGTQTVVIDTGSDICWIQCRPCVSCYQQQDPIFDPAASSSYSILPCSSTACANLFSRSCSADSCVYTVRYLDNSFTTGFLSSDRLALNPTNVINNFTFGCGNNNGGLFRGVAGLFGLGRGSLSLNSQFAPSLGNVFSYCLPFQAGSTGFFTLGGSAASTAAYTPMLSNPRAPSFYFIDLVGLSVGGARLPVTAAVFRTAGIIIDSGTVITRLPPAAYSELRSAFRSAMTRYSLFQVSSFLDTCYDFTGAGTVTYPKITLHYNGVDVTIGASGIFYPLGDNSYCLAFSGNSGPTDLGIIGNVQQKTFEVIHDVGGRRIGFVAGACA